MCINAAALLFMRYFGEARLLRASASKSHNKYSLKNLIINAILKVAAVFWLPAI